MKLTEEELLEAAVIEDLARRRLFGNLAYRGEELEEVLVAGSGVPLVTERSRRGGKRQQVEIALASLKRVFGIGETLAKTLVGLVARIAAKICAYTSVRSWSTVASRMTAQGRIMDLWA